MPVKLSVFNPSDYSRGGCVTVPWQPIHKQSKIKAEDIVILDSDGNSLAAQVDQVDPAVPSRDALVFVLTQPISPGPEDYSTPSDFVVIKSGVIEKGHQEGHELALGEHLGTDGQLRGITLRNSRMTAFFNLIPNIDYEWQTWYAGTLTSVLLDGQEILDLGDWLCHDPEKRCMQVSQVELPCPPWEKKPSFQVDLFNTRYRVVSRACGPVRVSITVSSEPFDYPFSDPITRVERHLTCELNRVISLDAGADYIVEELYIKGIPVEGKSTLPASLHFTARYFAYINMGQDAKVFQFPHVPDWFAIGTRGFTPYPGYGFATDMHATVVANPHPDFPKEHPHRTFSWETLPGKSAKCLHLFMRGYPPGFDARIGHHWYEFIYKPLKAEIA